MKDYLRWSLRQLYLIFFWPTQFEREVEDIGISSLKLRLVERLHYLLKMFPLILVLSAIASLIAGYTSETFGIAVDWERLWIGMALGLAMGLMAGVTVAVVIGIVIGVASSLTMSVAYGTRIGLITAGLVTSSFVDTIAVGAASGTVIIGMGFGVTLELAGVRFGLLLGMLWGVVGGVAAGIATGVLFGVLVGIVISLANWLMYFRLVTYPFDAVLSAIAYFVWKRRPDAIVRAWRWTPVAWNEVIWLPLPYVSKMLVMIVKQDRKEGFRQIAFVALERRLQRRAALKALVQVAIDDLRARSINELANSTDKLDWTTDAPAELPDEMKTALPRFDRAAQHAGQYLTLHNVYRKGEALKNAITEIEALQRILIATRGRVAPQLLRVASEWRRLIETEIETIRARSEAAREIPNPFVFGNPVVETERNLFTGRRDIARQIEASILGAGQVPTLLLHGPRRMGKTSILNQLPRLLGPDFAPAVVDCQNPAVTGSTPTLLRYVSGSLAKGLQRRRVTASPLTAPMLEREPFAVFDEWLDVVERAMPQNMRALLCIDEYEHLKTAFEAGWGASFLDALRHMLQHRQRIVLMFTGAHTFQELGSEWTDRFISARRVRVSFLTPEEVLPLLTEPIPEFDMTYATGALDALICATRGQPFLTQAVAFELVQHLNEQQRKEATPGDVETAMARALVSGGEYFANVWSDAGELGQAILRAIARRETPPDYPDRKRWLVEHDVLNEAGEFAVPLVEQWVRKTQITNR